jgi:hypothetical protein
MRNLSTPLRKKTARDDCREDAALSGERRQKSAVKRTLSNERR